MKQKLLFILLSSILICTSCQANKDDQTPPVQNNADEKEVVHLDFDEIPMTSDNDTDSVRDITKDSESSNDIDKTQDVENSEDIDISENVENPEDIDISEDIEDPEEIDISENVEVSNDNKTAVPGEIITINWNDSWTYADHSMIHSSPVTLYRSSAANRKNIVITVNAGHGTKGGSSVKTLCHPDGSPKTTGGSTGTGATQANAISAGMTFPNGTPEASVTLKLALILKDVLLNNGYDVLMIRETEDTQIDNVARTVYANNNSNAHISLHYDSTENNKGFFVIGVPDIPAYKSMEPVASHYEQHNALASSLISGAKNNNIKLSGSGFQGIDLTQTSYSTIPSVDIEVGDKGSDYSEATLTLISQGILDGLNNYFGY